MCSKTALKSIYKLNNTPLRSCLGVPRITLNQALYALSAELPPERRALLVTCTELIKAPHSQVKDYVTNSNILSSSYDIAYSSLAMIFDRIIPNEKNLIAKNIVVIFNTLGEHPINFNELPDVVLRLKYENVVLELIEDGFTILPTLAWDRCHY